MNFSLQRPIGALGEFSPGLMCIRSGAVTVELRIGRRGYVPGESIQFYVEVENNSRRKLQDTSVSLVQVRRSQTTHLLAKNRPWNWHLQSRRCLL